MNSDTAIEFLKPRQLIPPNEQVSANLIREYDEVRRYFLEHPDPVCILPFLNSFGDGDGLGVYVIVDEVLWQFSPEQVLPHLIEGLQSEYRSVRFSCADIAVEYPAAELIEPLVNLLQDADPDVRSAAVIALEGIPDETIDSFLTQRLECETDADIVPFLVDALQGRSQRLTG